MKKRQGYKRIFGYYVKSWIVYAALLVCVCILGVPVVPAFIVAIVIYFASKGEGPLIEKDVYNQKLSRD